jgi:hypothetical protein
LNGVDLCEAAIEAEPASETVKHRNYRRSLGRREPGDVVPDLVADSQLTRHLETPEIELG